jgi:hypothetical protein
MIVGGGGKEATGAIVWTSILFLGLAVNLEPTRIGIITLLLTRPKPIRPLLALLCGGLIFNIGAGVLVLFVFKHVVIGTAENKSSLIQIVIGAIISLIGAVMLTISPTHTLGRLAGQFKGASLRSFRGWPVVAGSLLGLPSLEYLALLGLIANSRVGPFAQLGAMLVFLLMANLVTIIPMVAILLWPNATKTAMSNVARWLGSLRFQYGGLLILVLGLFLMGSGIYKSLN